MIGLLNQLEVKAPVVFRLDGGNDTRETLKVLDTSGHFFVVKRNLRTKPVKYWLSVALWIIVLSPFINNFEHLFHNPTSLVIGISQ